MHHKNLLRHLGAALVFLAPLPAIGQSGSTSNIAHVELRAIKPAHIGLRVDHGSNLTAILVDDARTDFDSYYKVIVNWNLNDPSEHWDVYAYFADASSALSSASAPGTAPEGNIPSSAIEVTCAPGVSCPALGPIDQTLPGFPPLAARKIYSSLASSTPSGSTPFEQYLHVNLKGRHVPAGVYTGTLNLRAVIQ